MTAISDADFVSAFASHRVAGKKQFLIAANGYQCRIYGRADASAAWDDLGLTDLDKQSVAALKPIARTDNLFWADIADPVLAFDPTTAITKVATYSHISEWCKARDVLTKGRAGEVDVKTQFEVASLAAWRCQFDGCGEDLRRHFAGGKRGNYSYFAHIVASSPKGPRGDITFSRIRANDPENIMLLCDKCHRLIDRVDPERYDAEALCMMRERNIREVGRLLDSLQFPQAHMIVVGGNIEGQVAGFNAKAAENAMWSRKLRMAKREPLVFMRNGGNNANSSHQHYWETLFRSLRKELPALENYLSGTSSASSLPPVVAVFPTHVTSIQILSGRILGNSTTTQIFQPNRNPSPTALGERWQWPDGAPVPASNKYSVKELAAPNGGAEAALLVYLTAALDRSELPWASQMPNLPTLELRAADCAHNVIGTQADLDLLALRIDEALRILQDQWKAEMVHLMVIAPSSACVLLGQKLQARHHVKVVIYERKRDPQSQGRGSFVPTISICGNKVELVGTNQEVSLG